MSIERHRDAQQRCQLPDAIALSRSERPVQPVMWFRRSLRLVAHQARHQRLLMAAQTGDVRVAHQVFAVLMVIARIHREADFVQERAQFQRHALAGRQSVHRCELVEELRRQAPHVFAMRCLRVHPRRKSACLLPQALGAFVMRGRRSEMRRRQIVQDTFANPHAGHHHLPRAQPFTERIEDHRRDADHLGAVAPHAQRFHPFFDA